jgi:lysophospholipase L1-like esterase
MKLFLTLCLLAAVAAPAAPAARAQTGADFSRMVFVGDSLTAGFQDGALHAEGQAHAYPVLVAESVGTTIVMPYIAEPGVPDPNPATFTGLLRLRPGTCSLLGVEVASGRSAGRLDPTARATDVAVPGQDIGEALTRRWSIDPSDPSTIDTIEDLVLGLPAALEGEPPASQIETAVALRPTFLVVWLGSNDVLGAALHGTANDDTLTPVETFRANAHEVFARLGATGAAGAVLNVPDVTISPFLFSVRDIRRILAGAGISLTSREIETLFGVPHGSYVILTGVESIAQGHLPTPDQILTKREVKRIRERTAEFNAILRAEADARGWAYVDTNAFLTGVDRDGYRVPGVGTLTTEYLGGIFSLDGVHPTNTGQALVAGLVIDAINAKYGTSFARPDVAAIAAADPETCNARRGSVAAAR